MIFLLADFDRLTLVAGGGSELRLGSEWEQSIRCLNFIRCHPLPHLKDDADLQPFLNNPCCGGTHEITPPARHHVAFGTVR